MKLKIFGLVGLLLFSCNKPTTTDNKTIEGQETVDNSIEGVWTDGSGPNALFAIEDDSIRDVEHFTTSRYSIRGDTITIYFPDDTVTALMYKVHADTLVFDHSGHMSKYWKFKD